MRSPGELSGLVSVPYGVKLPRNSLLDVQRISGPPVAAGRALMVGGALAVSEATHTFHPFLEDHSCCKGSLLGIPCECHHLLIGPLVGGGKSYGRIRPGIIDWPLHLLSCLLLGWPLKPEALSLMESKISL